jgi:hypothetical protein
MTSVPAMVCRTHNARIGEGAWDNRFTRSCLLRLIHLVSLYREANFNTFARDPYLQLTLTLRGHAAEPGPIGPADYQLQVGTSAVNIQV